jgi:hypothetical protein
MGAHEICVNGRKQMCIMHYLKKSLNLMHNTDVMAILLFIRLHVPDGFRLKFVLKVNIKICRTNLTLVCTGQISPYFTWRSELSKSSKKFRRNNRWFRLISYIVHRSDYSVLILY